MFSIRKATISDIPNLLNLINNINEKEKKYLRYSNESDEWLKRIVKNIKEDHTILFLDGDKLFAFIEYTIVDHQYVWVYSLYFTENYRYKTYTYLTKVFNGMKQAYKMPIHFAVMPDNYPMQLLLKFIRAEYVATYVDGREEYKVKEVL
jgi:hypothetical protein